MVVRVEISGPVTPHDLAPGFHAQFTAILAIHLLPGFVVRQLGVEDQAVEIQDQCLDHVGGSIPEAARPKMTKRGGLRSPLRNTQQAKGIRTSAAPIALPRKTGAPKK